MEKINNINSCIMLAANLISPVSLSCVFDSEDLKDTGVEFDSHVTLLYAKSTKLERNEIMDVLNNAVAIKEVLGNSSIEKYIKELSEKEPVPVLDLFELGSFENDSGYLVLKLKQDTPEFKIFSAINEGLSDEFGVKSDFSSYNPHLTIAELNPGLTKKYLNDYSLNSILRSSQVCFEDLILSYGMTGVSDFTVYNLTCNMGGDRFFRIRELRREAAEL
jgi:2'-5' RNA ligase